MNRDNWISRLFVCVGGPKKRTGLKTDAGMKTRFFSPSFSVAACKFTFSAGNLYRKNEFRDISNEKVFRRRNVIQHRNVDRPFKNAIDDHFILFYFVNSTDTMSGVKL